MYHGVMKDNKTARLAIRITEAQRNSIRLGAALRNMEISEFVLDAVARQLTEDGKNYSIKVRTETP